MYQKVAKNDEIILDFNTHFCTSLRSNSSAPLWMDNLLNVLCTFGWPTQNENSQISKLMTKTDRSSYNLNIFDIFKVL